MRPRLAVLAMLSCLPLAGCFGDVGFAAAKTATLQAKAARNAVKTKDEDVRKINEALAIQAARNAQLLGEAQRQAEQPSSETAPDGAAAAPADAPK